jgi:methyl-accepting chemotaxis protein
MKLKTLLVMLALLVACVIGGFSALAHSAIGSLGSSLTANATQAQRYAKLLNDTRAAQVAFQLQVQEWKNILIRGNDKELFDKYSKAFETQERSMDQLLLVVKGEMEELKLDASGVDRLLAEHKKLGVSYRQALAAWDPNDELTGKAVDKTLRGIDRATSGALTDLSSGIEQRATEDLAMASAQAAKTAKETLSFFLIIAAAALAASCALCWAIGRGVLRQVGGEPSDLAVSLSLIAKGDMTQPIAVRAGDESSIAASAAMMQMRVRAMVRSIRNGSQELDKAASAATLGSSAEEVKAAMREARKAVEGLGAATDRFKV